MAPQIGKWVVFITRAWDYSIFISKLFHLKRWTSPSRPHPRTKICWSLKSKSKYWCIPTIKKSFSFQQKLVSFMLWSRHSSHNQFPPNLLLVTNFSCKEALSEREIKFGRSLREWVPKLLSPLLNGDFRRIPGKSGTRQMTILVCVFSVTGTNGLNTLMREKFSSSCFRKQNQTQSLRSTVHWC